MLARHLKLKTNRHTRQKLDKTLWHLTGCYNWAVKTIARRKDAGEPYSEFDIFNLLSGHSKKTGVSSAALQGAAHQAFVSWQRCWALGAGRPRLKGRTNRLNSLCFRGDCRLNTDENCIKIPGFGRMRYHQFTGGLPAGKTASQVTVIKKPSGWYAVVLFSEAQHQQVVLASTTQIGIDTGFKNLITTSQGEVFEHPRELEARAKQLAKVQRGGGRKRAARLQEKIANQRKDRNHKISHDIVRDNKEIFITNDNLRGQARRFGKSVASSGLGQLRNFIIYKGSSCGRKVELVASKFTTQTCSSCGTLTGPQGWSGLNIRSWVCAACGAAHDRDVNAAINVLKTGARYALDKVSEAEKPKKRLKKSGRVLSDTSQSCPGRATS